jgi:hypothetical protein
MKKALEFLMDVADTKPDNENEKERLGCYAKIGGRCTGWSNQRV